MRRRLTVVIVSVVLATLVLVGAGTLVVAGVRARTSTARELRTQARELADTATDTLAADTEGADEATVQRTIARRLGTLRRFARLLEIDEVTLLVIDRRGVRGELPAGITSEDLDLATLAEGGELSGSSGRSVWAAAATERGPGGRSLLVIVQRTATDGLVDGWRWFLLSAGGTLLLGVVAARGLAERLSRPVRTASAATHRIAAGDLSVRMPEDDRDDELADLARSVNAMTGALQRSRHLEQEFLLSVSHDLRTPLTSIRGYAEAIIDGATSADRSAPVILAEATRLERLVADLLELAKLRSTDFRLVPSRFDLGNALVTAAQGFEPVAAERRLRVSVTAQPGVMVDTDRDRLGQVLANLLENASKFAVSAVTVSMAVPGEVARIDVDDDGPGIAPDDAPFVFDRLYVSRRQPERRENGSGLGLAIVRELVVALGGRVSAGVAPSGGARFTIELPLDQPIR